MKFHSRIHKSPILLLILSYVKPVHTFPSYFYKIHFNMRFPPTPSLPSGLLSSGFLIRMLYTFNFSLMRAIYSVYVILLDFMTPIILYLARSTIYEALRNVIFSMILLVLC
jgi:hypothetical protein